MDFARRFLRWPAVLLPGLLLCASPGRSLAEASPAPRELALRIGGHLGETFEVSLHRGKLTYSTSFGDEKPKLVLLQPTAAEWTVFRKTLDEIGVWKWEETYLDAEVMDGTQWSAEIVFPGYRLESMGSNKFPPGYERYREAVKTLLGGRRFE